MLGGVDVSSLVGYRMMLRCVGRRSQRGRPTGVSGQTVRDATRHHVSVEWDWDERSPSVSASAFFVLLS